MLDLYEFKNEFITCCHDELLRMGAAGMQIEERQVSKPQLGMLNGILFKSPDSACAPTLYVEDFYPSYMEGLSVAYLSHEAVGTVLSNLELAGIIDGESFEFDEGSNNLKVRLINMAQNREYLQDVPYCDLGCGFVLIADLVAGEFRANINNDILEASGMTREVLFERALLNSAACEPAVMFELTDAICNDPDERCNLLDFETNDLDRYGMLQDSCRQYVLSNSNLFWGSAALFYPGVMEKIRHLIGGDYYVLPSSVHELIIMAVSGNDPEGLVSIIRSANRIAVNCDDILSDDLYVCRHGGIERVSFGGVIPGCGSMVC